jgi:hypothetical protein
VTTRLDFHDPAWEVPLPVYRRRLVSERDRLIRDNVRLFHLIPHGVGGAIAAEALALVEAIQTEVERVDAHLETCPQQHRRAGRKA